MAFGSEMVKAWETGIDREYVGRRASEIEGADAWVGLRFGKSQEWLFLSWDHTCYGCCQAPGQQLKSLSDVSTSRPPVLAALKKHLAGATLTSVTQINRDRVLQLNFSKRVGAGRDQETLLIVEAAGRYSNLVLTAADGVILEAAHHVHPDVNRYRSLLPGQAYTPPPPFDGTPLEGLPAQFHPHSVRSLAGIGKKLSRVLEDLWQEGQAGWKGDIEALIHPRPEIALQCQLLGNYVTLWPRLLPGAAPLDGSPLEASATAVFKPLFSLKVERFRKRILSRIREELHRISLRLNGMRERLDRGKKAALWNHEGEMLLAYPHLVDGHSSSVEMPDWENGQSRLVEIDPDLDAVANAKRYFLKAKKARQHVEAASREAALLVQKTEELQTDLTVLEKVEDPRSLLLFEKDKFPPANTKRKGKGGKKDLPAHLRYELDDCLILVGLSAKGNRYVTFELAAPDDIWFHAQDLPGSHVIIKVPLPEIPERVFLAAASLAAYYSRSDNLGKRMVDYTERRHVRHIRGSGPANVTFKNSSSIRIDQNLWRHLLKEVL